MDLLDLFDRGSKWAASKIPAATDKLDRTTPCDKWDVRTLLDHMVDTQEYFAATARGEEAPLPNPDPPARIGDDPVAAYDTIRSETLRAHREPGVLEKTGPSLGIAFVDQLVHGWDLAVATGQDATMPEELAEAGFAMVDGRLSDDQRGVGFKPAVSVPDTASAQQKLLAYTGRTPA
jgi:uncharacterized protein (TIGR03086 family)